MDSSSVIIHQIKQFLLQLYNIQKSIILPQLLTVFEKNPWNQLIKTKNPVLSSYPTDYFSDFVLIVPINCLSCFPLISTTISTRFNFFHSKSRWLNFLTAITNMILSKSSYLCIWYRLNILWAKRYKMFSLIYFYHLCLSLCQVFKQHSTNRMHMSCW